MNAVCGVWQPMVLGTREACVGTGGKGRGMCAVLGEVWVSSTSYSIYLHVVNYLEAFLDTCTHLRQHPQEEDDFDAVLAAVFEFDAAKLLTESLNCFKSTWFTTHLADVLSHIGSFGINDQLRWVVACQLRGILYFTAYTCAVARVCKSQSISHLTLVTVYSFQVRIGFKRVVSVGVRHAAHGGWRVDVDGMSSCAVNGCPHELYFFLVDGCD